MPGAPGQQNAEASSPGPGTGRERRITESVPAAMLLAFVGGYLDAFLYIVHGHGFAGAMTGNSVLFGLSLLSGDRVRILHHAIPLLAFVIGVWLAECLLARVEHHAVSLVLACEAFGLLVASFLPGNFPEHLFVFLIALIAAFQIASFRKAGRYSYNSTFVTGDLRTAIIGLYEATNPEKRKQGLDQAGELGLLFLVFLAGAVGGGFLAIRYANHALWLPAALLGLLFVVTMRRPTQT